MRALIPLLLVAAVWPAATDDLDRLLARWKPVQMPLHSAGLSRRERRMVGKLADAARYMEDIYWRQSDPAGLALLQKTRDPKLRRLLMINGSRFDLIDGNRAFAGDELYSPGAGLYPRGLTRAAIESYVAAHPDQREAIYSPYSVIERRGAALAAIPYRVQFKKLLEPAAQGLRDAAKLSDDAAFARFLRLRADALLSDDYYASDLAWLELKNPKFDVIFAPYETYIDGVLGIKTSYAAAILMRNDAESRRLAVFEQYISDLQDALPLAAVDRPSQSSRATPMEVVDSPFRTGDLRHGYQAVADNLPNDPRIHAVKGSKKIFFKNFLDARVDSIIVPLAGRLMAPQQAALATREAYLTDTLLHEISHGLGPLYARMQGKQVDIREALGPQYAGIEEAKADAVGLFAAEWLAARGVLARGQLEGCYAAHVADLFRMLRFGAAEAHAISEIMQFSFLVEQKAIVWNAAAGRYAVRFDRMPDAVARLAQELLEIEASGDTARATKWFARYHALPPETAAALEKTSGVPVDIDPSFSFNDRPR